MCGQTSETPEKCGAAVRLTFEQARRNVVREGEVQIPPRAKQVRLEGVVRIEACVSETGEVIAAKLVSGHPLLVAAAQESARQWRFKPLLVNGRPAPFKTVLEIWFSQGSTRVEFENKGWYVITEGECRDQLQANQLDEAVKQCQRAVDLAEKLPKEQTDARRSANGLAGEALLKQRKFDRALSFFRRELEIGAASLQSDDAKLAEAHQHVARALEGLGNAKEAGEHYKQAEQIRERSRLRR